MTIVELRQYTLNPGRRDDLIALFEREFVETQEAEGIALIGQFRDLDAPDRFVWLRGFPDMERRRRSLEAFYTGPVWQAHREAANATMIDSDDVLLLRPLAMEAGFGDGTRPPPGSTSPGKGAVAIGVHRLSGPKDRLAGRFIDDFGTALAGAGLRPVAVLTTKSATNSFPRLPVREGEWVLVWIAVLADAPRLDAALARARSDPELTRLFASAMQTLRLQPTTRSRLHG